MIYRQGIYHKRFFGFRKQRIQSLSLQEYAEMEEERMRKMPEKWPMTVAAKDR